MVRYIDIKKAVNNIIDSVLLFNCNEKREYVTLYVDNPYDVTHIIEAIITGQRNASTLTMTIEIKETKCPSFQERREKKLSIKESTKREIIGKYAKDYDITITECGIWYKLIHEIKVGKELADGINSVLDNNK